MLVQTAPVAGPKPAGKDLHAWPVWGERSAGFFFSACSAAETQDEVREPDMDVDYD
jgi:hypothetical protein